jgi:putative CocE/NonD family hydrolase
MRSRRSWPWNRVASLVVVLGLLPAAALAREAVYEVEVEANVMVPMRDGVRLATDIYRPAKDGEPLTEPLPAILTRLPYNKDGQKSIGRYYAARGYVFVAQDTRGRYQSEGVWHMLTDDGPDGYDTAKWLIQQPWSNGKFGMMGTSYFGGTQHAMAMAKAPGLVTVIPVDAMANLGYQSMRNAGAFELRFWNWILLNAGRGSRQARDPATATMLREMADQRIAYLQNLPLRPGTTPLKFTPEYEQWLVEAMRHGANGKFWEANSILDYPERYKDIPVYLVGGWYDSWGGNTTASYQALSKTITGPVYLIMGPWIHGAQSGSAHGQVDFGEAAAISDHLGWRLQWFDHWLKDRRDTVGRKSPFATPVRVFVMGSGDGHKTEEGKLYHGGSWRDEQEWPLARTQYREFYLQPHGGLAPVSPDVERSVTRFQFDPRDPVPTIGGCISSGNDILLQGAWDQRGGKHVWNFPEPIPVSARNDVLVFQTEPLEQAIEVTGEISLKLWISSSAPDTDFTAKLIDVYPASPDFPGGFDLLIGDGIIRTRFRESLTTEKLMQPGEVYPVTIKLYPTSNIFKKGHRIRADISSSNFPRFDVNPNTGEPLNQHRRMQTAVNTVYHDQAHASHILLPVIP